MATSTFYKNIYIDEKAADVLIDGIRSPKPPRPNVDVMSELKRGDELLERFFLNLETSKVKKEK